MFPIQQLSEVTESLLNDNHLLANLSHAATLRSELASKEYINEANRLTNYINSLLNKLESGESKNVRRRTK